MIFVSGERVEAFDRVAGLRLGGDDYLAKPFAPDELLARVERLLARLAPRAGLVTLADAAPASLSWIGGVLGHRVAPLGVEKFGQTGSLAELYAAYRLDGDAITESLAEILLQNG